MQIDADKLITEIKRVKNQLERAKVNSEKLEKDADNTTAYINSIFLNGMIGAFEQLLTFIEEQENDSQ